MDVLRYETGQGWDADNCDLGTTDGHFRKYPGDPRDRHRAKNSKDDYVCDDYDPRKRPWFVGASTGPKDIVLVLDASGSMNNTFDREGATKWELLTAAVYETLDTLTIADRVNVVVFSDEAKALWTDSGLVRATEENINETKEALKATTPANNTNFSAAFKTVFSLLWDNRCDDGQCSSCQKIILFLTDGKDTSGWNDESVKPSEIANTIDRLQRKLWQRKRKRATIFTYSMSEAADDAIPRQIACANGGAWAYVGPRTDPLDSLISYYLYTAAGLRGRSPIWIEPYEDASGLGIVTTVAMPFYAKGDSDLDIFLGVVGHDVLLEELNQSGASPDDVLHKLIERSAQCGFSQETPCELQVYRHAHDDRALCVDPLPIVDESAENNETTSSLCYEFRGDYYRGSSERVRWKDAVSKCRSQGGQLVSIEDDDELAFVARLASLDGSWIGANKTGYEVFSWLDDDLPDLSNDSTFWGVQEPRYENRDEECAAIDSRGAIGNMHAKDCNKRMAYVCKFQTEGPCGDKLEEIPERGYFNIPPLDACADIRKASLSTKPVPQIKNLSSSSVVCDFTSPNLDGKELICCSADYE